MACVLLVALVTSLAYLPVSASLTSQICVIQASTTSLNGAYDLSDSTLLNNRSTYSHQEIAKDLYLSYALVNNSDYSGVTWAFRSSLSSTLSNLYCTDSSQTTDPLDCGDWSDNDAKVKDCDDVADVFDSDMSSQDYIWLVITIICFLILIALCIPISPLAALCRDPKYIGQSEPSYAAILRARGYDPEYSGVGDNRTLSTLILSQDLKAKIIYENDWKTDFFAFVKNEHSMFSPFFANAHHPLTRRKRRWIFVTVILTDFTVAIYMTYFLAFLFKVSGTTEFILDYCLSYILGTIMAFCEGILVKMAMCQCVERYPKCCRDCIHGCGDAMIVFTLWWSVLSVLGAMGLVISILVDYGNSGFWGLFVMNFIFGLVQNWFVIEIVRMGIIFYQEWKIAHPKPPKAEDSEDKKEKRCDSPWLRACSMACCCCLLPIYCLTWCFCKKEPPRDPNDNGQSDYGVTFTEFELWKAGETIPLRSLPQSSLFVDVNTEWKNAGQRLQDSKIQAKQEITQAKSDLTAKVEDTKSKIADTKSKVEQKKLAAKSAATNIKTSFAMKLGRPLSTNSGRNSPVSPANNGGNSPGNPPSPAGNATNSGHQLVAVNSNASDAGAPPQEP